MSRLFGTEYAGFIASSYAITLTVIVAMIVVTLVVNRQRRGKLKELEERGLRRAGSRDG